VFLRGNRELLPGALEEFPVQSAKAGETVEVSTEIVTPPVPGRYTAFFRLADTERNMFGPRMWVDLIVPGGDDSTAATADKSPKVVSRELKAAAKEEVKALKVAAREETKALKVAAKEIKKELKQVARDAKIAMKEAKKEIKRAQSSSGSTLEGQTAELKADDADFYDSGEGETQPSAPPAAAVAAAPAKPFVTKWPIQMTALHNMGFDNEELNEFLLDKEKGNVQTVCNVLLQLSQ